MTRPEATEARKKRARREERDDEAANSSENGAAKASVIPDTGFKRRDKKARRQSAIDNPTTAQLAELQTAHAKTVEMMDASVSNWLPLESTQVASTTSSPEGEGQSEKSIASLASNQAYPRSKVGSDEDVGQTRICASTTHESIRDSHNSHPNECDSHLSSREHVARVANRVAKARREAALRKKVMEDTNVTRHNIMSFLDTKDYLAMMGTSKAIRQPLFAERFDINSRLSDFVKDPIALRQLWCDCNALVGGDMLMRMLDGNIRRGSSLEFFVEAGQRFKALDDYIISEGYKVDSRRILGKPSLNGGTETISYKAETGDGDVRVIQIITSRNLLPLQLVLIGSIPSVCFNFMSWNKIFSAFPHATYVLNKTYIINCPVNNGISTRISGSLHGRDISDPQWMCWKAPGPTIGNSGRPDEHDDFPISKSLFGIRRIGDQTHLTIALNTDGIQPTKTTAPDSVLEMSHFKTVSAHCAKRRRHFRTDLIIFDHPSLEHRYLVPKHRAKSDFAAGLKKSLDDQGCDEVRKKIPREEWLRFAEGTPSPHDHISDAEWTEIQLRYDARRWLNEHWDDLKATEDWRYFDSRLPAMYAEWERDNPRDGLGRVSTDDVGEWTPEYENWLKEHQVERLDM